MKPILSNGRKNLAREPFKTVKVIDETTGFYPVAQDSGFNIAMPVYSSSGAIATSNKRVRITSVAEFLRIFNSGRPLAPKDHITMKFAANVLLSTPIDVFRVDTSKVRVGMTSEGEIIYADRDFEVFDKVTEVSLDFDSYTTHYGVELNNGTTGIFYYMKTSAPGTAFIATTDPGDLGTIAAAVNVYDVKRIDPESSISDLLLGINSSITGATFALNPIISVKNSRALSLQSLTDSGAHTSIQEISSDGSFLEFSAKAGADATDVGETNFFQIDNTSFYFEGNGLSSVNDLINPEPVSISETSSGTTIKSDYFMALVADAAARSPRVSGFEGADYYLGFTLGHATAGLVITEATFSGIPDILDISVALGVVTIGIANDLNIYNDFWVSIGTSTPASGEFAFICGSPDNIPSTATRIIISSDPVSFPRFMIMVKEYLDSGQTIVADAGGPAVADIVAPTLIFSRLSLFFNTRRVPQYSIDPGISDAFLKQGSETIFKIYEFSFLPKNENSSETEISNGFVKIGNNVFFNGTGDSGTTGNKIRLTSSTSITRSEFFKLLSANVESYFDSGVSSSREDSLIIGRSLLSSDVSAGDSNGLSTATKINSIAIPSVKDLTYRTPARFAIFAKFPIDGDRFSFDYEIDEDDDNIYNLNLMYASEDRELQVTFEDIGKLDGFGNNLYFDRINPKSFPNDDEDPNFVIRRLDIRDGDEVSVSGPSGFRSFGSQILQPDPNDIYFIEAVDKLEDVTDKYYDLISDAGEASTALAARLANIAAEIHSLYPVSFPINTRTEADAKGYRNSTTIDGYNSYFVGDATETTNLGSFSSVLPMSLAYIEKVARNHRSFSEEFTPIFGARRGSIGREPKLGFIKKERERLLDSQINTIKKRNSGPFINFNLTAQTTRSYLSEENIVRALNKVNHVTDEYLDELEAEYNTESLRSTVVSALTDRINNRVANGKNRSYNALRVICDSTNNSRSVIEAREIVVEVEVEFQPSIANRIAFTRVKRLGSISSIGDSFSTPIGA
jgi:hypothetical protein